MMKRLLTIAILLAWAPAQASMEVDGAWRAGVWATTVWADGVWYEGAAPTGDPVPDVVGLAQAAAESAITTAGFTVGTVSTACSGATAGNVISQAPSAGTTATAGSAVDITTSTGVACVGAGGKFRLKLDLRL
jgi:hypothetical protein